MSYTVINHKDVKNDVLQAKDWYKRQQEGLEKRFVNEVKITLNCLINNHLLFQVKYKTVRTAYTEIFLMECITTSMKKLKPLPS